MSVVANDEPTLRALPAEVTSFVGRREERQTVRALMTESRLVTLTGFGGIGKTRLALRVAADVRRAFSDGVRFVSLAGHSDPDLVAQAITSTLGMEGRSTRTAVSSLVEYLAERSMLLVLDNCEHLVDSVAVLADTLLRTCPSLRLLATSREPLRIQGEAVHHVRPLTVPAAGNGAARRSEAVDLFLDRARATVENFEVTDENRETVAAIVTRLEGIPLAIELAAGRLGSMSPTELDQTLDDAWEVLSRGSRAAPERQRTMGRCIEWSFRLCTPAERELWGRLAVFSDGFELDAARSVCADTTHIDDVLSSLVDKSIVTASTDCPTTRFRMLPPLRQRGLLHLQEHDELMPTRLRHRDWCTDLVVAVNRDWMSAGQLDGLARLRRELGNIQTALETCYTLPGEAEKGLWMGAHALELGLADGLFRQGRIWFDRLLAQTSQPTEARALALRTACWWAAMQGDLGRATRLLEEGERIADQFGGRTRVLLSQAAAFVAMFTGDYEDAADRFETVIKELDQIGEQSQAAHSLTLAALNHTFRGETDAALAAHAECLARTKAAGEEWYRSYSLWIAGLAAWVGGDTDLGVRLERESLRLKRQTGDQLATGTSLEALAWFCTDDDPDRAARLLGAAQDVWDHIETSTAALGGLHRHHMVCVQRLNSALGPARYDSLHQEGRTLGLAAAIDLALNETTVPDRPATAETGAPPPTLLTRREQEIADLAATGLTNAEIASKLVLSKRTVETHMGHVLAKLGLNTRHQLANRGSEH